MQRMKGFVCFLILFIKILNCNGQALPHLHFQKKAQLSQNTVFNICQDRQGFIWIGTGDGLNRYDGIATRVYKPTHLQKEGAIQGRVLRSKIFDDNLNRIWFSTEDGVQYLNKINGRFYKLPHIKDSFTLISSNVYPIIATKKYVWVLKLGSGLFLSNLENGTYKYFPFPDVKKNPESYFGKESVFDSLGRIWIAEPSGLYIFDTRNLSWNRLLVDSNLACIQRSGNKIYCSNNNSIFRVNSVTLEITKINYASNNKISCLHVDYEGNLWAGSYIGDIFLLSPQSDSLIWKGNINAELTSKAKTPLYSLYVDRFNILWAGTDGCGLLYAPIKPNVFYQFPQKGINYFVKAIYEESQGRIWVGTEGQGILTIQTSKQFDTLIKPPSTHPPIDSENDASVSFIKEDSYKNIWVGFKHQLYVKPYAAKEFKKLNIPVVTEAYNQNAIRNIYEIDGSWLVTTRLGTISIQKNTKTNEFSSSKNAVFGPSYFSFISPFKDNLYIAGFNEGGLSVYERSANDWKKVKQYFPDVGFISVYRDTQRNRIWLGTNQGLIYMNPETEKYRLFTEEDGLKNGFIYGILASDDDLWVSSNGGLSRINLLYDKNNNLKSIRCKNFTEKDGLQSNEFNSNAFLKGKDGAFYFGGINGLNWFYPTSISPNRFPPEIVITDVLANNKPIRSSIMPEFISILKLDYKQNDITIRFSGIDFYSSDEINYAYQLIGWGESKWYTQKNNEVRFSNLLPGKYEFLVKAANSDGVWSILPRRVQIIIKPPFWRKNYFYILLVGLFVASIILITRYLTSRKLNLAIEKMKFQQALDIERQRISKEMHDDIGAGLTQIVLMSQSARNNILPDTRNELDDIADTSRRLMGSMNEIIWSLNPEFTTLEQLFGYMREQLHRQLEYSSFNYSIDFPEGGARVTLRHEQRRNLLLIVKEIVNNAIKYSGAHQLTISAELSKQGIRFTISDDGCGFDKASIKKGNGLKNIKHRVEELKGQLEITTMMGSGCIYQFEIPY